MKTTLALFIAVIASSASAQTRHGSWIVGKSDDETRFMFTMNDSGNILGKWCNDGCRWILASKVSCEEGARSPALVNTKAGSASVSMVCGTPTTLDGKTMWRQYVDDASDFDSITGTGGRIGIAVAMENEEFRVMRFAVDGVEAAVARFQALASAPSSRQKASTRDMRL